MLSSHWIRGLILSVGLVLGVALAKDVSESTPWLSRAQEQALSDTAPPPPALNSPQDQADLAAILEAQKTRTPEIEAECKRDQDFSYKLFQSVYGINLTPEHNPKFFQLMKNTLEVTRVVNETAKNKYQRLRPYQGHPDTVKSLFSVNGFSYPSGHSMGSFTLAVVLGAVLPEKQQAFLDRALQIAQSRVDAGVHYPSDIHEGETLGKATGAALLSNSSFQSDLTAVKVELQK